RKKVRKYGEQELQAKREQAKVVMDTFRGYTELEVSGAFPTQQASFLEGMDKVTQSRVKLDTIMRLPLFLSELSVIVGLTLLVACGSGDVKVLVGVFAVAAFRLLPALRAILTGWTQVQNVQSCLDVIEEGLKGEGLDAPETYREIRFEKEIRACKLSYVYPGGEKVLDDFEVSIRKGEYVGFRGYSGVGKSTLFNLFLGLLKPTSGEIQVDGVPLTPDVQSSWLRRVGYVPQEVFVFHGTLAENIALGCKEVDRERIERILQQVSLEKWLQGLPDGIDTVLGEAGGRLSGGQKQRIGIARALYKEIDVLLLDEATSALDNATEKEVNETLSQLKRTYDRLTILSIAHRESSLAYCDRVITIENEE
ncbi:MAG: ABC transporter ATP-binding protein, partial [Bacteroides sp.]|nr:ABC transporter ATP-binding protein [Bacteroides sp.]